MLDYLGDLALLTFLAFGLYLASAIPGSLLWLMVVRYPLSMIGVLVLYFVRGPTPLMPTMIGRLTTLATTIVLLVIAFRLLLTPDLPPALWVDWLVVAVQPLLAANIIYLIYRGVTWQGSTATTNEALRC
jgi:phosphatidylglycerophosphate synthase